MPAASFLLAFALTALVIVRVPGPSVMFIVSRALADGRRVALLSVLGNTMGEYLQVIAVAFGVGLIAERSVAVFTLLKLFGAVFLVYLGIKTFRARRSLEGLRQAVAEPRSDWRHLFEGLAVGVSNPKTVIFLAAILPQFVSRSSGHVPEQIRLLGATFSAFALVCDSTWGVTAAAARAWFARSPRRLRAIGGVGGLAIIAIGMRLAVTGRKN